MPRAAVRPVVLGFAVLILLPGCQGSKNKALFDPATCTGTWIEVTDPQDPGYPARVGGPQSPPERIRILTINPDQTFEVKFAKPDGTPIEGMLARGTWKLQRRRMLFEITESTIDQKLQDQLPDFTGPPRDITTPEGTVRRLRVVDRSGGLVVMKPQS